MRGQEGTCSTCGEACPMDELEVLNTVNQEGDVVPYFACRGCVEIIINAAAALIMDPESWEER